MPPVKNMETEETGTSLDTSHHAKIFDAAYSVKVIPALAVGLGSYGKAALLAHIKERWEENGCKPFLAFRIPCRHHLCTPETTFSTCLRLGEGILNRGIQDFKRLGIVSVSEGKDKKKDFYYYFYRAAYDSYLEECLSDDVIPYVTSGGISRDKRRAIATQEKIRKRIARYSHEGK